MNSKNLLALLKNGYIYYSLLIQNILIKIKSLIVPKTLEPKATYKYLIILYLSLKLF